MSSNNTNQDPRANVGYAAAVDPGDDEQTGVHISSMNTFDPSQAAVSLPIIVDPDIVMIAGDWHGNLPWALKMIRHAAVQGATCIVQLGDFGYWGGRDGARYLDRLSAELAKLEVQLYFIDGNHENFDRLLAQPIDPTTGLRPIRGQITHIPRGFRWTWHGQVWLALGGATSVDRLWRTAGHDWWQQESLTEADVEAAVAVGRADVMVCHDCPAGVDIPAIRGNSFGFLQAELALAQTHRQTLARVVRVVRPKVLFHGHYHDRYDAQLALSDGGFLTIRGLDMDESTIDRNTFLVRHAPDDQA